MYTKEELEIVDYIENESPKSVPDVIYMQDDNHSKAMETWTDAYVIAKEIGYSQLLDALEDLAGKLGFENGLVGWERV